MKLFNVVINGKDNYIVSVSENEARKHFQSFEIDSVIILTLNVSNKIQKVIEYYEDNVEYL